MRGIFFLFCMLALGACDTTQKASNSPLQSKKGRGKQQEMPHSKLNFPYIEAFHQAMRLKIRGNDQAAIEAFQHCISLNEKDDALYYALGQLYTKTNNLPQATQMLSKAYQLDPGNIWYAEQLATCHYENKDFEKAIPLFKKLVEHEPKNLQWLYQYGDCFLQAGKINDAIGVLNQAENIIGKHPSLALEKYSLYLSIKKEKEALSELHSILAEFPNEPQVIATLVDHYFKNGNIEKGTEFLSQLVRADPHNGRAHLTLGEINRQQGNMAQAFTYYKNAFTCPDIDIDTKMDLLVMLQNTHYSSDPQTMELIEMMVTAHPKNAKSYTIKGDYLMEMEDEKQALTNYRLALQFEKNQFAIWHQVLLLEYQNSEWEMLYQDSKEALDYFTSHPIVYFMHGLACNQLHKSEEAIEILTVGRLLLVNDPKLEIEFLAQLGESYLHDKQLEEGKKYYLQAIELDPSSNILKNNFAYSLCTNEAANSADFSLALSLINQAIERSPNTQHYYDTRGWILFKQGNYQQALQDINKAFEIDPTNAVITEHLGDVYAKLNELEKALYYWKEAVKMGDKNTVLSKKIETQQYHEK